MINEDAKMDENNNDAQTDKSKEQKDQDDDKLSDIVKHENVHMDEEFDEFDMEEFKKKYLNSDLKLRERKPEEKEFEDEFDIHPTELAQERLKHYRGLENLKYSFWHRDENLPEFYNKMFRFRGFAKMKH
mmetsp:Transcript_33864/g.73832  ORF Transcript_33864/g.73832 Transcript_33864/m.73832 type:complete len:130 (+) Transcript_33864:714-1103(+)|eukprot:CAMPEP_0116894286 /NCGR_PEP_ID=MMETSP0467-20121206/4090_1 /TAXON_ID=283647 /ORGANISM="Mesodinium pulex, Strain SPMC105" /LENGTH=129 /DNA_ID=CAMNT_0004564425 /DNA_START=713 /DNA_END=1102 /DNA_ORIENTATION=+